MPAHTTVVAMNQSEMQQAQGTLVSWFEHKGAALETELTDSLEKLEQARANGWRTDAWKHIATGLERRLAFYQKGLLALREGYTIIPSLDIDVFAIRTKRNGPLKMEDGSQWRNRDQSSEAPQIGEGRYVDATPIESSDFRDTGKVDEKGNAIEKQFWWADEFAEVDFPFRFAPIKVLESTQHAMALKVFDEIGVLPARRGKGDPMVVGRIKLKGQRKSLDFLIAWFIDTRDLP